jgi:hypothetical protein
MFWYINYFRHNFHRLPESFRFINLKLFNWFVSINTNFVMYKNVVLNLL